MANRRKAPVPVRARSRGQVSNALEHFAELYRGRYPEREVRYVYDPQHKPELSGVIGRQAQGYEMVTRAELGLVDDDREKETVRVGDLVLMSIPREEKEAEQEFRGSLAREQMKRVERDFYAEQEKLGLSNKPEGHTRPPIRPVGEAKTEEREFQYDHEQREE